MRNKLFIALSLIIVMLVCPACTKDMADDIIFRFIPSCALGESNKKEPITVDVTAFIYPVKLTYDEKTSRSRGTYTKVSGRVDFSTSSGTTYTKYIKEDNFFFYSGFGTLIGHKIEQTIILNEGESLTVTVAPREPGLSPVSKKIDWEWAYDNRHAENACYWDPSFYIHVSSDVMK